MLRPGFKDRVRPASAWEQAVETAIEIFLLLSLVFLPVFVRSAFAGIHPVPLEKGTTDAQCAECHEDKTKGKVVHPAVSMGCLTCHLIRNANETTRVNLKTARVATLCFECHADKKPAPASARQVHAPAAQDCLKCHDAHVAANERLLLKPTSGGKADNLCLGCHKQGVDVPDKGSRHAALDMGCETCHVSHKAGERGKDEFAFHLTKGVPELCVGCHDPKEEKLVKAHQAQPIAAARCTNCHDPHDSKSPKLLQKYVHMPFGDKSCDACHQPASNGKVVLAQSESRALCVGCHDEQAKKIEAAKVAHPGAAGDCTQCHNPHAGKYPRFVQPNPVTACESCHAGQAEIHDTKKVLHQPAYSQSCSVCHTPHGGEREHLLRADGNALCLSCHGPNAASAKSADGSDVTIFDGAVRLPESYFSEVMLLRLDAKGLGHPQARHPVGGVLDPSDPNKAKQITCVRCHNPHGGGKALLVTGSDASGSLCSQCHTNLRTTYTGIAADTTKSPGKKKKK
jgi:predicted CXXCH cytochrome family protein